MARSKSGDFLTSFLLSLKEPTQKQIVFGWAMYDWANSAFSTVIVSTLFGPYISNIAAGLGKINLFSFSIDPYAFYPFCVSISVILQFFFLPAIGALSDIYHRKKKFLILFAVLGALFTALLFLSRPLTYLFGKNLGILATGLFFIMANCLFGASVAIYDSYLLDISSPEERDSVSSFGWTLGYLGGGICLAICLLFFWIFSSKDLATRISFLFTGLWWLFFTILFPLRLLPYEPRKSLKGKVVFPDVIKETIKRPFSTLKSLKDSHNLLKFFLAYLFYNDGIQTVIVVASLFAASELKAGPEILTILILFIQFWAFGGSLLFGKLGERMGTKKAIILSLFVWCATTLYAYLFLDSIRGLFILSFFIALVLDGTQALSRSFFSKLIKKGNEAELFSFYQLGEKGTSWLGPFFFGLGVEMTGSIRSAILSVLFLLIVCNFLMFLVKEPKQEGSPVSWRF